MAFFAVLFPRFLEFGLVLRAAGKGVRPALDEVAGTLLRRHEEEWASELSVFLGAICASLAPGSILAFAALWLCTLAMPFLRPCAFFRRLSFADGLLTLPLVLTFS